MKKILNLLILFSIIVFFSGCGWGWFVPYSFQPSYHEFKKMCKLNELPNNEEKYNKILSYFGLSLDTLDWEELNREAKVFFQLEQRIIDTMRDTTNFSNRQPIKNGRILYNFVLLYRNKNINSLQDLESIKLIARWDTRRYDLGTKGMASYELEWQESFITCDDIKEWK